MEKQITHYKLKDGSDAIIIDNEKDKLLMTSDYFTSFDKKTGYFCRSGFDFSSDANPEMSLPEIADIEISTICSGIDGNLCPFCYKGNNQNGKNMLLPQFIKLFDKLPKSINQIAFGIGDIDSNPDIFDIFKYTRDHGVIPNVTINGWELTDEYAKKLSELCGAVAVSMISDLDVCLNAVKKLTDLMKQVNIHFFLSQQTLIKAWELINKIKNKSDERLKHLNAIVFLSLKKKGRAITGFSRVQDDYFKDLVIYCLDNNLNIGFDSCSAGKVINVIKETKYYDKIKDYIEPCESDLYSFYINVDGQFFPCSFMEGIDDWKDGLDVLNCNDFLNDIWWNEKTLQFKKQVLKCRECNIGCPIFEI